MPLLSHLRVATRPLVSLSRAYGSAAAVQLDFDYYYCDNEEEQRGNGKRRAMEESEEGCDRVGRGVQWVVIGDPVARRHVYAERLSKLLDVPHISMGTLVRQELHPHSALYKQVYFLFCLLHNCWFQGIIKRNATKLWKNLKLKKKNKFNLGKWTRNGRNWGVFSFYIVFVISEFWKSIAAR